MTFLERFPEHTKDVEYIQVYHAGQKRHHGSPYYLHPIATAEIGETVARAEGISSDADLRRGFLYHDVKEDNKQVTWEQLSAEIGPKVVEWIVPVTKVKPENWKALEFQCKLLWTTHHYRDLRTAPIQSRIIKISDRIHNLSETPYSSFWFQQNYLLDTSILLGALQGTVKEETFSLLTDAFLKVAHKFVDSA